MSLGLVGVFLIIYSYLKLGLHDPVGLMGVIFGIIVVADVLLNQVWPKIKA